MLEFTLTEKKYKKSNFSVWFNPPITGPQCEFSGESPQRAAGAGDGCHDGGVLSRLLAALRSDSSARDLRPP